MSPVMDIASASFSNQTNSSHNLSAFQLPKRKFPTFSDMLTQWQSFDNLFTSILSHTPDLPDVERFEYLKMSLTGEALALVLHLTLTATNYTCAWEILRSRYGNKRDLARVHLDSLLATQTVKSKDATSIQQQVNTILENTAALDNLDFVTRQWSPLLVHLFEKNLDYELRARWELVVWGNYYPQVSEFMDFFRSHLRSADIYSSSVSVNRSDDVSKTQMSVKQQSFKPRSSGPSTVLAATTSNVSEKPCPLCNSPYSIRSCKLFTNQPPSERFLVAKSHRLCINCLGSGHSSMSCNSKYKCQTCKKSYHSLLHFTSTASLSTTLSPGSSNTLSTKTPDRLSSVGSHVATTSCLVRGQPQKIVLLSTAIVEVYAAEGR
ncbi:uncharacterized protein LOC103309544 [Acyrthosiphon pisum]|uniref:Uncharacterized protein n=1 Tax=Acyrthosiphon pisum TaxID=7029 RepID=A0A8R2B5Y5_ACYPI|nr:uncharacterized protein LOC103309544 [Acyrthosiphon pisum]|eukprot:XP_008183411.1 PREDICTED: uncharacterized protein LOC103309544 [Acyrthosiphon pisum]